MWCAVPLACREAVDCAPPATESWLSQLRCQPHSCIPASCCAALPDLTCPVRLPCALQGHQAVFEVGEHQLDALAGSDTLKAEVITQVGALG